MGASPAACRTAHRRRRPPIRIQVDPEATRIEATPTLHREGTPGALAVAPAFGFAGALAVEEVLIRPGEDVERRGDPGGRRPRGRPVPQRVPARALRCHGAAGVAEPRPGAAAVGAGDRRGAAGQHRGLGAGRPGATTLLHLRDGGPSAHRALPRAVDASPSAPPSAALSAPWRSAARQAVTISYTLKDDKGSGPRQLGGPRAADVPARRGQHRAGAGEGARGEGGRGRGAGDADAR